MIQYQVHVVNCTGFIDNPGASSINIIDILDLLTLQKQVVLVYTGFIDNPRASSINIYWIY